MKRSIALFACLAGAVVSGHAAAADTWPSKAVTIIVPFPAGGGTDAFVRPLAQQLGTQLGQSVVVDNRGGAGGTVGAAIAARAAPDGYTFFVGGAHHAIAPSFYKGLTYDIEKDFVPITLIAQPPQIIVAAPTAPFNDLKGLIAHARSNPGKLNFGSAGNGTSHHLAGELFKLQTGVEIAHVPYTGAGPMLLALMGSQVDLAFDGLGSSAQHIRGGKIKPIAVAASRRSSAFPEVPTAAEAGLPGYEVSTWYAMWAPKGTPQPVVQRMYAEVQKALETPELKKVWLGNGSEVPRYTSEQFGKYVHEEVQRWAKVAKDAGVKAD
ncbi:MAG: tripartite tricarboxylate transporter substrate binding protein [Pigmentiphaga sp.]|uniref:Bug family tripartite tricarboxylate transporter substrate binding protein n=1 Tax=Pigmentiphaga sp. TaxID=1977564 RepID=UPI0029B46C92|nr:tripartite tricarboxylate transporter substrate binding protein [Pigmentiphaga sp.]MDX3905699.1 tripartite tricarboxylate transporter substrate binding protein [Pigmentiphaga sp.]